uniref:RNA polymerase-associated protein LEO1 n=1 Tax=Panagrellus redivivus TaxID=6233 RepID=A0A7E4UUL2_PANRE
MSGPPPSFSDSDSDSSSSSSDAGPRALAPSSHSGLSDEEDRAPVPAPSQPAPAAPKPRSPSLSSSMSSSSSDNEDAAPAPAPKEAPKPKTPSPARSASPPSTPSERATSPVNDDVMGSLSPSDVDMEDDEPVKKKPERRSDSPMDDDRSHDSDDDIAGPRLHQDPSDVPVAQPPIYYDVPLERGNYGKEGPALVRWPNFISVDPRPFTEETYDCEGEDVSAVNDEGRSKLQLKVENCIRWRKKRDDNGEVIEDPITNKPEVESNAKMVRYSDGSMTLHLGSEIYEVNEQKIEEYNHLFLRMRSGLHGNAVFKKRYNFRPISTDSMTHRKMTMTMAEKTNKSQRVKILADVGHDPEAGRMSLIRKEDERMRAVARREAQQRKQKERQYRSGLSQGFLEDRDDYEDDPESLSSIKKSYQGGSHRNNRFDRIDAIARRYMSDDEDGDDDSRRIEQAKIESDEDDDMPSSSTKKREEKKKRKIVISDDEDD